MKRLVEEASCHLTTRLLPFWMNRMVDDQQGGFKGRIDGNNIIHDDASKGVVLNTRILWTFSSAYRLLGDEEYLRMATRAKDYLLKYFWDNESGGLYWSLNPDGTPLETKKQIYAQGFGIYALSEYFRATADEQALEYAKKLFLLIEKHSFDPHRNGYFEAFAQDWSPIADMRLSDKDANEKKTMNTHLHILEPYTNLYRVWKDDLLKQQLGNLIALFMDRILDGDTFHLGLFFDEEWVNKRNIISYGHDIEASWLLHEAALVFGNNDLLRIVEHVVPKIVEAALEGLQSDSSLIYEKDCDTGHVDADRHWWVQAEAVVGLINLHQHFGDERAKEQAVEVWHYIQSQLIDPQSGEWYWSINADGSVNRQDDLAGFWKCPYHNGRMCLELIERG